MIGAKLLLKLRSSKIAKKAPVAQRWPHKKSRTEPENCEHWVNIPKRIRKFRKPLKYSAHTFAMFECPKILDSPNGSAVNAPVESAPRAQLPVPSGPLLFWEIT